MAYQISYDYKEIKKDKLKRMSVLSYIFAVTGVVVALLVAQFGGCLLDGLLTDEQSQIQYAVDVMAEYIRDGATVDEAVAVFCGELDQ